MLNIIIQHKFTIKIEKTTEFYFVAFKIPGVEAPLQVSL